MKCMSCGKEMKNTIGGCYSCECGYEVNDCVLRTPRNGNGTTASTIDDWGNPGMWVQQGWVCPKCGAVLSPSTTFCPFCAPAQGSKITYGTSTGDPDLNLYTKTISEDK